MKVENWNSNNTYLTFNLELLSAIFEHALNGAFGSGNEALLPYN